MASEHTNISSPTTSTNNANPQLLKIITFNITRLIPYKFKGKVKLLSEIANTENPLIISLSETHIIEMINDTEILIPNYVPFRTDRLTGRKRGGVITYMKDSFATSTKTFLSNSNSFTEVQVLYVLNIDLVHICKYIQTPSLPYNIL